MINLELEYREMALLRELLRARRLASLPTFAKDADPVALNDFLLKNHNPWCSLGQCNLLLDKIDKLEEEIQKELAKKPCFCGAKHGQFKFKHPKCCGSEMDESMAHTGAHVYFDYDCPKCKKRIRYIYSFQQEVFVSEKAMKACEEAFDNMLKNKKKKK